MAYNLDLIPSQPTRGGGQPVSFGVNTSPASNLAGGLSGTLRGLVIPVLQITRGTNNPAPTISTLFEIIISGGNCPPIRRYPATGQRGTRAWVLL